MLAVEKKDSGRGGGYLFFARSAICLQQSGETMERKGEEMAQGRGGGVFFWVQTGIFPDTLDRAQFQLCEPRLSGASWREICGIVLLCAFGRIRLQNGSGNLPSGMRELEKSLVIGA